MKEILLNTSNEKKEDAGYLAEKILLPFLNLYNGYTIQGKNLIVVKDGCIHISKIKKELSPKDLKLLNLDLKKGLRKISSKLVTGASITVTSGSVYIDDLLLLIGEKDNIVHCYLVE